MNIFEYILIVSLCSASISYTISCAGIFEGLRRVVSKWGSWFEDLIHCPYCLGHYITLAIVLWTLTGKSKLIYVGNWTFLDLLFVWFACVCMMSLFHFVMVRAYKPVAESETLRKIKESFNKKRKSS